MSTDKESSAAGTDNRPPISIKEGPTPHPQITVIEGQGKDAVQVTRDKTDEEFTVIENNRELADIQATNILSQGLLRHVFNILNQTRTGKEIWDNVELLMKGNESIHDYFVRFHKLINDMKITQLNIPTHQMNTKFVNNLPPYWAKYVINVKNNKDISATTYVELYTYLKSYEPHAIKTLKKQEQSTSTCKEKKRVKDSQYFKDKMLLMEAKEKGTILNAEAEAFLADVECTAPYDQPLAITTTSCSSSHEEVGLNQLVPTTSQVNEVYTDANQIFDNVNHLLTHEMHQEEHLDSDVESDINDNTIPYHQYQLDSEVQDLAMMKTEMVSLERNKVKHDLDQTIIQRNKRNAKLEEENVLLKSKLSQNVVSINSLKNESKKVVSEISEDSLVHAEVSRTKMSTRLGTIKPINYAELNALYSHFVPQKELSREQVYWLPAEELATQISNPPKLVTPFVRTRPAKSQISTCLRGLNSWIPAFAHVIDQRTDPCRYPSGSGEFKPVKAMFTEQIIPFYENVKQLVQKLNENIVTEVTEYMRIFDELDTEYERCVWRRKRDICSIVLYSDVVVTPSSNCSCDNLRLECDREHNKVLELEAEISKQKRLITESEKRFAFLEQNYVNLQLKFQNYKQCSDTSSASNAIFEINKLRDQLQGKDTTIRNLDAQINIMKVLNVGSAEGSVDNVSLKRRYDDLSKANTYSRTAYTEKLSALTSENTKLKALVHGKTTSGPSTSETLKVLASGMYTSSSKTKPATESRKPMPKSHTRYHRILPSKSVNARRAADHNRKLNVVDHN
ncbi:hypothetical protein Tco_0332696 [Tanacetum coccineum]